MELRQLESFRAVLREGSFTAAAKKLHMTQPAVSLHIKALEEELGARLLDRDGRGVRERGGWRPWLGCRRGRRGGRRCGRRRSGGVL